MRSMLSRHCRRLLCLAALFVAVCSIGTPALAAVAANDSASPFASGGAEALWLTAVGIVVPLKDLLDQRKQKVDAAKALKKKADDEKRDLTEDESRQVDTLLDEAETLSTQIEERRAAEARGSRLSELERRLGGTPPARGPEPGGSPDPVTNPDSRQYSLLRAINLRVQNKPLDGTKRTQDRKLCVHPHRAAGSSAA